VSRVAVVGSGQSGLICAERLARRGIDVLLVERLPALGGQEPEADIDRLVTAVRTAGVRCALATLAVQFQGGSLQTLGVDGAAKHPIDVLVVATGTRPASRAELGISGDRCAGVTPGPVALHLIAGGVLLGRRPVVLGGGQLASECAAFALRAGASRVTVVAPHGLHAEFPDGVETHPHWAIASIHGSPRVSSVTLDSPGETLACDAVILASERRPVRNIEGAVFDGSGVVFCHSTADPKRESNARETAETAVARVGELLGQMNLDPAIVARTTEAQ
jgi:pyruvate/2-oxoglutarate dehydrogenase complex dihydrolipoamide dehydrogenase (E3) component